MRKVLIIALGLASLGAIASVQPAAAQYRDSGCIRVALNQRPQLCVVIDGVKTCHTDFNGAYNQCVSTKAEQQKAAKQQVQNYINNAQSPTGILGAGKPPRHAQ